MKKKTKTEANRIQTLNQNNLERGGTRAVRARRRRRSGDPLTWHSGYREAAGDAVLVAFESVGQPVANGLQGAGQRSGRGLKTASQRPRGNVRQDSTAAVYECNQDCAAAQRYQVFEIQGQTHLCFRMFKYIS